jgi:hypothetical protein
MVKLITLTKSMWGWWQEKHFQTFKKINAWVLRWKQFLTNSQWKHTDGCENVDTKNNE